MCGERGIAESYGAIIGFGKMHHTAMSLQYSEFRGREDYQNQGTFFFTPGNIPSAARMIRIIAFIEDDNIIQIILKHLGLWETRNHDPPRETAIETIESIYDGQYAQAPLDDHWVQ